MSVAECTFWRGAFPSAPPHLVCLRGPGSYLSQVVDEEFSCKQIAAYCCKIRSALAVNSRLTERVFETRPILATLQIPIVSVEATCKAFDEALYLTPSEARLVYCQQQDLPVLVDTATEGLPLSILPCPIDDAEGA